MPGRGNHQRRPAAERPPNHVGERGMKRRVYDDLSPRGVRKRREPRVFPVPLARVHSGDEPTVPPRGDRAADGTAEFPLGTANQNLHVSPPSSLLYAKENKKRAPRQKPGR